MIKVITFSYLLPLETTEDLLGLGLLGGALLLSSQPLLSVLHDGQLDAVTLGEGNHRLLALSDHEHIGQSGGERSSELVSQVDDLVLTSVLLSVGDHTNTADGVTSGHHGDVSVLELDEVQDLSGGNVNLDGVVDLDLGIGELDCSGVVGHGVGCLVVTKENLVDLAELEGGLLLLDLVDSETTLGVPQESEVLVGLLDLDNIHETSGESHVSSDLAVNSDQLLHNDHLSLVVSQSVLESVSQKDDQRKRSSDLVGTSRRLGGPLSAELIEHPVAGCCVSLQMLLWSTSHLMTEL